MPIRNYLNLIFPITIGILLTFIKGTAQTYNPIDDLAWSADGTYLAVAYDDGQILVFDSLTGYTQWQSTNGRFVSIDWHPTNPNQLAYVSLEQGVYIVDVSTGKPVSGFTAHPYTYSVAFSPDGMSILTSHSTPETGQLTEGYLRVIDLSTATETITFEQTNQRVTNAEWNSEGNLIAGINEGIVVIWDATTGNIVHYLSEIVEETDEMGTFLSGFIQAFAFSPDGIQLLTANGIRMALWDAETFNKVFESPYLYGINDIDWSPDGTYIAAASGIDRSVYILDALTGNIVNTIPTGIDTAVVRWDASGSKIAFGGESTTATIVLNPTLSCDNPVDLNYTATLADEINVVRIHCLDNGY